MSIHFHLDDAKLVAPLELYLTLHFVQPIKLPAIKLYDNLVQLGALAQRLDPRSLGILVDLLLGILPLLDYQSLMHLLRHTLLLLRNQLQLQDVAVLRRVMGQVGQEEEDRHNIACAHCCWECRG